MKALIEKQPTMLNSDDRNYNMLCQFNSILQTINQADNENYLRDQMDLVCSPARRYFDYGFGSNHMWVHQRNVRTKENNEVRIDPNLRILIVEFDN